MSEPTREGILAEVAAGAGVDPESAENAVGDLVDQALAERPNVTDVGQVDPTEREAIVADRKEGKLSLAELKAKYGHIAPFVLIAVLEAEGVGAPNPKPDPAGVREPQSGTRASGGTGGNGSPAPSEPRYATPDALGTLPERVAAARLAVGGRGQLAALMGITGGAAWRHEHARTHPDEVQWIGEALAGVEERIASGEFAKAEKPGSAAAQRLAAVEQGIGEVLTLLAEIEQAKKLQDAKQLVATATERLTALQGQPA